MLINRKIKYLLLTLFCIAVYIFAFEFIIPYNKFIPAPTAIFLSVSDLYKYHFFSNFLYSFFVVYVSIALAFIFTKYIFIFFNNTTLCIVSFFNRVVKLIPVFVIMLLFIVWFISSEFIEILFIYLLSLSIFFSIITKNNLTLTKVKDSLISFPLSRIKINSIQFQSVSPAFLETIIRNNSFLWSSLLMYEFVKNDFGLGSLLKIAYVTKDFSMFFTLSLIAVITILLINSLLKVIHYKFFYWEIEQ